MMDHSTTLGGNPPFDSNTSPSNPAEVEGAAQKAHRTVDSIADKATAQLGRVSGTAHRAVSAAADAATSATEWASKIPEQAKDAQTKITEAACNSIRARPISSVVGALVIGYLLGRLARL